MTSGRGARQELEKDVAGFLISRRVPDAWTPLASSVSSRVWQIVSDGESYVLKYYLKRGSMENIKALLRGTRARRAWASGQELLKKGFSTPELQMWGEQRIRGLPSANFIVTSLLPDAAGVYSILRDHFQPERLDPEKIRAKRALISLLGSTVGALHARGICHGDLRLDNILVTGWQRGEFRFHFIDNERNRTFDRGISKRCRLKNLVQLNTVVLPQITSTDRLRFFRGYLAENASLEPARRIWMRDVQLATRRRLSRRYPALGSAGR